MRTADPWYRTIEMSDAEGVWERMLETKPRSKARLIEVHILRSSAGDVGTTSERP